MKPKPAMSEPSQLCFSGLLFLLLLSGITAASLRDHRLRESNAPNQDMLKALEYIRNLRQTAADDQDPDLDLDRQRDEAPRSDRQEDKSEELLQAVLSTLRQSEKPAQELPLMFEDNREEERRRSDGLDRGDAFKRTNENVEEKYTPQTLATLQSVFDELSKVANFNSKRENREEMGEGEEEDALSARDLAYDDAEFGQDEAGEEERQELARALDYLDTTDRENAERFVSKRSSDFEDGETANLADFYLLKVLEQTEEEEQKNRELEEEQEEEEEERMERAAEFRSSVDPKWVYRLLQISQKYQIPPEDLIDMLRSGESLKIAPVYAKNAYKKPRFFGTRLPPRQKTPEEVRTERILKILGLSGDDSAAQSPYRKQYKSVYARPTWRQGSPIARQQQQQQQQKFPAKVKDDYDDTENELATFLAARMLSKYPSYKSSQKREDEREEEEAESFERAVRDYFDRLDSDRSETGQMDVQQRGAEGFDNEDVMKLLSFANPDEQDAKKTE